MCTSERKDPDEGMRVRIRLMGFGPNNKFYFCWGCVPTEVKLIIGAESHQTDSDSHPLVGVFSLTCAYRTDPFLNDFGDIQRRLTVLLDTSVAAVPPAPGNHEGGRGVRRQRAVGVEPRTAPGLGASRRVQRRKPRAAASRSISQGPRRVRRTSRRAVAASMVSLPLEGDESAGDGGTVDKSTTAISNSLAAGTQSARRVRRRGLRQVTSANSAGRLGPRRQRI